MAVGFFSDVPDIKIVCDGLRCAGDHVVYFWTFTGTHSGTKRPLRVSGWEEWDLDTDYKVKASRGWYDADDFARQTGGAIHISSTVGAGTTVTLYLPRNDVSAAADPDGAEEIDAMAEESAGERILVVEDDPNVRRNVVEMLTELGYSVTEAETGAVALTILKKQPDLDLVFSDIALPGGCSGRDLAEEIVRAGNGVKVLLTTGVPDHANHKDLKMASVPVLVKPYRYTELARAIRSVLTH